jgi:aquaporin Z
VEGLCIFVSKYARRFSGIAISGIVGLAIFFLVFISGDSTNPARSLTPAVVSGVLNNLWLYWSATFIGTTIVAIVYRRLFA